MPRVFIKTYGCQMNERDSEAVAAQLVAKGYTLVPSEDTAGRSNQWKLSLSGTGIWNRTAAVGASAFLRK